MASSFYPTVFQHLLKGDVDLDTATVKVLLLTDSYTFSASHNDVADLSGEVSGGNYERKTVSTTLTEDLASSGTEGCYINFDLTGDATWTNATFTCQYAVMFIQGANDADSKLLYYFDLGANQTVSSGTFSLLDPSPAVKLRRYNGS